MSTVCTQVQHYDENAAMQLTPAEPGTYDRHTVVRPVIRKPAWVDVIFTGDHNPGLDMYLPI